MDKRHKYLFTIRSLTGGGAERVVSVLTSHMAKDGYDVSIIAYDKTEQDYPVDSRVKIYYMPKRSANIWGKAGRISDMRRLIKKIQPDVIIPFVGTVLYVSYLASRPENVPFIRTIRISPWFEAGSKLQKLVRQYLNKRAAAIMVQNEEQIAFFPDSMRSKIFVVPNPISETFVNIEKTHYADSVKKIVTAGRLTDQKNHTLLIRAMAEISKKYPDVTCEIYGTGVKQEQLQQLIESCHLENNCILKGRSANISDVLINADLFVLSSDYEGMPNALMEAMAVGLPSISSDCQTGPKSLITHRENGLLFETGNLDALVQELEWAIRNPAAVQEMGREGRKHILEQYTYDHIYQSLIEMLSSIDLKS